MNMETPFLYGRIAENENFTNRRNETEFLKKNFKGLINTVIISPRRWGKTSLVHKVAKLISEEEKIVIICQVDIFNCRTEEEFYIVFANFFIKIYQYCLGRICRLCKEIFMWASTGSLYNPILLKLMNFRLVSLTPKQFYFLLAIADGM